MTANTPTKKITEIEKSLKDCQRSVILCTGNYIDKAKIIREGLRLTIDYIYATSPIKSVAGKALLDKLYNTLMTRGDGWMCDHDLIIRVFDIDNVRSYLRFFSKEADKINPKWNYN